MQKLTTEVKKDDKVIGVATFERYDSVEEAENDLGTDDEGNSKLLKLINSTVKQRACNAVRVDFLQNTPTRQISRIARSIRRGDIDKASGGAQIRALLEQMDGGATA